MYFRDSIVDEVCGVDVEQLLGRGFVALVTWRSKAFGLVTTSRHANEREQLKRRGKRLPSAAHVWKLELDERNDEEEDLPEKCSKVSLEKKKRSALKRPAHLLGIDIPQMANGGL